MKKIRELLRGKRWKWTLGGVGCLLVAAILWGSTSGIGVRAAGPLSVNYGGSTFTIPDTNNDGVYEISTAQQLECLRTTTRSENFELVNDIGNIQITTPATGTFSGDFNGNGHVLTITSLQLSNDTEGETEQVDGALFGTVSGTVQNLIVEIADDSAKYTRTTKTTVTGPTISYDYTPKAPETVRGFDVDLTKFNSIHGSNKITEDEKEYAVIDEATNVTQISTYTPDGTPSTDTFGILCGQLTATGTINQVFLNGNPFTVNRKVNQIRTKTEQAGTMDISYYYEKGEEKEQTGTALSAISLKVSDEVITNDNLKATLEKLPSSSNETHTYQLTLVNQNASKEIEITSGLTGWTKEASGTAIASNESLFIAANGSVTLNNTVSNSNMSVTLGGNVIERGATQNTSLTIQGDNVKTLTNSEIGLTAKLEQAVLDVQNNKKYTYTLTLENTSDKSISITAGVDGWKNGDTLVSGILSISVGNTVVLTKDASNDNSMTVSMTAKLGDVGDEKSLDQIAVSYDQSNYNASGNLGTESLSASLEKKRTVPNNGTYTYTLTLKNKNAVTSGKYIEITSGLTGWTKKGETSAIQDTDYPLIIAPTDTITLTKTDLSETMTLSLAGNPKVSTALGDIRELKVSSQIVNGENLFTATMSKITSGYQLTLNNNNTEGAISSDIEITGGLTGWTKKGETSAIQDTDYPVIIKANSSVEFTNSTESSVTLNGLLRKRAITYSYTTKKKENTFTAGSTAAQDTAFLTKGNELYAGGLVGTVATEGTITACKQNIKLIKENTYITNGTGNTKEETEFGVGGILGKAESMSNISDIYLLGKVKEGDQESNTFVGTSEAVPATVALNETDALNFANGGNLNWSTYQKFTSPDLSTTGGDLAWLVKQESESESYFTYTTNEEEKKITADIISNKKITGKALSYAIVYNARKSLSETTEDNLYLSNDGTMALENSGYYRIKHAYATDGYYHYQTPVTDISTATMKYPYLTGSTPAPSIQSAEVVRASGSVTDMVKITLENVSTGTVYYNLPTSSSSSDIPIDTSEHKEITSGVVEFPFEVNDVYYRLVPVIGEKIYPALTTEHQFTQADRQPIPKPTVTCYDFYNSSGALNSYTAFVKNGSYQEGSDMKITPQDSTVTGYELQYLFSTTAPEKEKWDENQRYTGTEENPSFFSGASKYEDGAVIPDKPADNADVYLYVQVKKNNYASQIYYYGPFKVTAKDVLSAQINGVAVVDDNYRVLEQDVVTITGVDANKIQTMVSKTAVSGSSRNFTSSNTIAMRTTSGGYVYARINYGNNKYSEIQLFEFTFGDKCTKPRVTPNTGLVNGSATSISPATKVTLSSPTPDAKFFYLESENQQTFTLTRATSIPDNVSDGGKKDGYRYFQVGNRWYKTSSDKVEKYTGELSFTNDENNSKTIYLSVAAVADDYEASETVDYIYTIQPKQQVANPQAALETRNSSSGGNNVDIAPVRRGANIAFYTETPEAKLYYTTSTDATSLTEAIPAEGIEVTGDFGENFVVRVQAKKAGMLDSDIITFIYEVAAQDTVMTPTATPGTSAENPTTVIPGNKILLSSTTKEATIFYTTNGTSPLIIDNGDGTFSSGDPATTMKYDPNQGIVMPLDGSGYFMITAVAVKKDLANSPEAHFTYTYPAAVLEPYATMDSGYVTLDSAVYLKNVTENAVIYYTVAYGDQTPEDPSFTSAVFNEEYPFTITQKTTIKAMAAKDGVRSKIATFTFIPMAQLEVPKASIESGSVVARGTVLELKTLQGAGVYYTMDGSDPLDPANTAVLSGNTITLNGEPGAQITIKAYAKASDKSPSQVVTFTYQISQNTGGIIASIENGSLVSNGTKVNLMSDVTNAEIYYTTDGSSPIDHGIKGTTVEIKGIPGNTFTIKAVAVVAGEKGVITTFVYKIKEKPTAPTASPAGGVLTIATRVSLSSGAEFIYYTTDGTEPTKSSTSYAEPILINRATTLKAIAVSKDGEVSEVAEYIYTAAPKAGIVTSSAGDGSTLQPGRKISLSTLTDGAVIYYSTDGTIPTMDNLDSMLVYDGEPIEINRSVTLQAVAYREDLRLSDVAIWNYTVEQIPAVLQKEAEAKKLAQEGLQETDASALARTTQENQTLPRKMKEQENNTQIVYSAEALPLMAKLSTSKEENSYLVTEKAKEIFGQDYTVLETYQFRVKDNNTSVQPKEEVEVAIPIPKGYEDAVLTVAYVEENRPLTTLETRRENEMLYAKTKKLGTFVIVGTMQEEKTAGKLSYLPILEAVAGITLLGGMGYFGFLKIQKFLKKRKKTTQRSEDNPKGV